VKGIGIQKLLNTFADRQLAAGTLALDLLFPTHLLRQLLAADELVQFQVASSSGLNHHEGLVFNDRIPHLDIELRDRTCSDGRQWDFHLHAFDDENFLVCHDCFAGDLVHHGDDTGRRRSERFLCHPL